MAFGEAGAAKQCPLRVWCLWKCNSLVQCVTVILVTVPEAGLGGEGGQG